MKILYCDIDNTVANQYLRIKKFKKKNKRFVLENKNLLLKDKIINHSSKAIKKLSNKFEIHWVSARPKKLYKTTFEWLNKKKFPIKSLNLLNKHNNKINFLKKKKIDLYIDDMKYDYFKLNPKLMTRFVLKLEKNNIKYEIFNNNWNEITKRYL